MKRCIALLLAVLLFLNGMVWSVTAAPATEELLVVYVKTFSNRIGTTTIEGLYRDNVFYIDPSTVAALSGAEVSASSADSVTFTLHGGFRVIRVNTNTGQATENQNALVGVTDMPMVSYDDTVYISASAILRYMGAVVCYGENELSPTHMMVSMPYTVLDALCEYYDADGYAFDWSEADGKVVDPETVLGLAALDSLLLHYDANVVAYMMPTHREFVEKKVRTDELLEILRVEGTELVSDEDPVVSLFGDASTLTQLSSNFLSLSLEWIGNDAVPKGVSSAASKLSTTGSFLNASSAFLTSLETAKQFANMSNTQKHLLQNTLGRVSTTDSLYTELPMLFEASKEATSIIGNSYAAYEKAAWDAIYTTIVNSATSMATQAFAPLAAVEIVSGVTNLDATASDLLDDELRITWTSDINDVSIVARRLLANDMHRFAVQHGFIKKNDVSHQILLKADVILALKSALASRLLLLETEWLKDDAASAMQQKAIKTAALLNKVQNAIAVPLAIQDTTVEDITWIENLAIAGDYGYVAELGSYTYYWQYSADNFSEGGYFGDLTMTENGEAKLMRRDRAGNITELLSASQPGMIAVNNRAFYANNVSSLYEYNLDGSISKWIGYGEVKAISRDGRYVIGATEQTVYSYDTQTGQKQSITQNGEFLTMYNDMVFYSPTQENPPNRSTVVLSCANADGSNNHQLYKATKSLHQHTMMTQAKIAQLRFDDEYVYFSYGSIGGTGIAFQGGRIIKVKFDGTDGQVIAGDDELVGAQFVVNDNGTVITTDTESDGAFFTYMDTFAFDNGAIYSYNSANGEKTLIANKNGYAMSDYYSLYYSVEWVKYSGTKAYYLVHASKENPDKNYGWRTYYTRTKSVMLCKDMIAGNVTEFYRF